MLNDICNTKLHMRFRTSKRCEGKLTCIMYDAREIKSLTVGIHVTFTKGLARLTNFCI